MRLPMLLGTETLISILLSTSHTCKVCSCLLGLYLHYSLCPFLIPSHPSCISPNVSVIEAFRDATCYSSALSDPLPSPSSCIFCYHCRSLRLYCLPSFKCTLNGKRGTSQFCSPLYPGILKYLLND